MNRAILAFGLAGLLCAGILAAADGAAPAPAAQAPGLCTAPAPIATDEPDFLHLQSGECSTYCPDGSQVSCTGPWEYCDLYYTCSAPFGNCAARCLNTISYCPGYGPSNCGC